RDIDESNPRLLAMHALEEEAWSEFERTDSALYDCMVEALDGYPTQAHVLASFCTLKLLDRKELSAIERFWLVSIMSRIVLNSEVANAVAMKRGRGTPKKGSRKMYIAGMVLNEILSQSVTSVEEAQRRVADRENVSFDTVKDYWSARKVEVCCS